MRLQTTPPPIDAHVEYILAAYDIEWERGHTVELPDTFAFPDGEWNVGLIVGPSGSGKSSILRTVGAHPSVATFDDRAVISNFDHMPPEDAAKVLTSVGLGSVPTWLRPYAALSTGERARADLALLLSRKEMVVVDEFTSTVNREVARSMSSALSKYVRRTGKKILVATCHYDVIEWLNPDWVFDTKMYQMLERDCLQPRPEQVLEVFRADYSAWDYFKSHHYMSDKLNKSARIYVATLNDEAVAVCAVLAQPNGYFSNGWRCSRLVVLPDFQGRGIGRTLNEYVGSLIRAHDGRYFFKTVNPAIGEYHEASTRWKATAKNGQRRNDLDGTAGYNGIVALSRRSYCHEYIGPAANPHDPLFGEFK